MGSEDLERRVIKNVLPTVSLSEKLVAGPWAMTGRQALGS